MAAHESLRQEQGSSKAVRSSGQRSLMFIAGTHSSMGFYGHIVAVLIHAELRITWRSDHRDQNEHMTLTARYP